MQLQLYALPVASLPQTVRSLEQGEPLDSKLNCLLQVSGLPHGQQLEVSVNETLKRWQEGNNQVFSWELQEYRDEINIHLHNNSADIASWRGLWKGNAIFHMGTLPIRVFFNGVEQPLADRAKETPIFHPSLASLPTNGRRTELNFSLEQPSPDKSVATMSPVETTEAFLETDTSEEIYVEDDNEERQEDDDYVDSDEERHEYPEDADDDEEYTEDGEEQQENQLVLEQDQLVLAEEQHSGLATLKEGAPISASDKVEPVVRDEEPSNIPPVDENISVSMPGEVEITDQKGEVQPGAMYGMVAAFHADPSWPTGILQKLKELLATMPKKTVVIDLREVSRARQKEDYHPLSRAHLRDDFGGKYWDRSQYIKTTTRMLPETQRTMIRRWERVVTNVDHPDGIPYLEKYLRDGYSMIFMDSLATYQESARHAVVEALRERIPSLVLGNLQ